MRYSLIFLLFIALLSNSCKKGKPGYTTPVIDPTNTYDNRSVGASAKDLLSGLKYETIILEVAYTKKHDMPEDVINEAADFLRQYCNKKNGVKVMTHEIPIQGTNLTVNNLNTVEKDWREYYEDSTVENGYTLAIFMVIIDGRYENREVLGLAYKNTSVAIFDGTIIDNTGGIGQANRNDVAPIVMKHELGHLLGLVNTGTGMVVDHQDEAHGKHCDNKNCLMYYTTQTTDLLGLVFNGADPELDDNCKNDLKANGGK